MNLPRGAYSSWTVRAVALIIDTAPVVLTWTFWEVVALGTSAKECMAYDGGGLSCSATSSRAADMLLGAISVLTVGYLIWNFGFRQGTRGSSVGKSLMKIKVVGDRTWQPIGFGRSVLRQLVHVIDAVPCFAGYALPLVDSRRQTLTDKVMSTVCIPIAARTPSAVAGPPARPGHDTRDYPGRS